MIRLAASDARKDFSGTLNRVAFGSERIVLERHGKDVAAVVPIEDLKLLQQLEDHLDLDAARNALKEEGSVTWKKLKAELGL